MPDAATPQELLWSDPYLRRFTVRGIDADGDVQAFHTDTFVSAESVRRQMEGDLYDVEMIGNERAS